MTYSDGLSLFNCSAVRTTGVEGGWDVRYRSENEWRVRLRLPHNVQLSVQFAIFAIGHNRRIEESIKKSGQVNKLDAEFYHRDSS